VKLVLVLVLLASAALSTAACGGARHHRPPPPVIRHCGDFAYGTDGLNPGPGGITARGVGCWLARAIALLGPPPGWHCTSPVGVLFVCRKGDAVVKFYGE
jgi:hypothetical protein